jgi:DNA-binding MarR family transcriptional regulator
MLDKLEQRQLIRRDRRRDNRRVVDARITPRGLKLLEKLAEPVRRCHQEQLGHLTRAELAELTALLKRARQPHESALVPSIADPTR